MSPRAIKVGVFNNFPFAYCTKEASGIGVQCSGYNPDATMCIYFVSFSAPFDPALQTLYNADVSNCSE